MRFDQPMLGTMIARFRAGSLTKSDWLARCIKIDAGTRITLAADDMAALDDNVQGGIIMRVHVNGTALWITPSMLVPSGR